MPKRRKTPKFKVGDFVDIQITGTGVQIVRATVTEVKPPPNWATEGRPTYVVQMAPTSLEFPEARLRERD